MTSVLFVCLGNICRSPAAEGILRHILKEQNIQNVHVESCGLGSWHVGQLPDLRMQESSKRRGIILSSRAQQFKPFHYDSFDYILAADHEVLNQLLKFAKNSEQKSKVHLITAFSSSYRNEEIPDPYYGGEEGFELVLDMLTDSCEGLVQEIIDSKI